MHAGSTSRFNGITIVLIEQNAKQALQISDGLVLEQGQPASKTRRRQICRRLGASGRRVMSKRKLLLGLIGTNIMGSLSPALFADAFVAAGIDGFYHLMDVNRLLERRLANLLDAAKATGFAGTNITYPFKQEVIALLDAVDPEAAQIGAVNTVAIGPEGRTTGYTDVVQFILAQAAVRSTAYWQVGIVIAPSDDAMRIAGFIGTHDIDDVSRPGVIV
jgi:shikimate dehydrogenase